MNQLKQNWFSN